MTSYVDAEPIFPQEVIDKIPESLKEYDPNQLFEDVWLTYYGLGVGVRGGYKYIFVFAEANMFWMDFKPTVFGEERDMSGLTFAPRTRLDGTFLVKANGMKNKLGWYVLIFMLTGCAHDKEKALTAKVPFLPPIEKQDAFKSPANLVMPRVTFYFGMPRCSPAGGIYEPGYVWMSGGLIKAVGPERPIVPFSRQ